ncbi:MAG: nucleoside hydrolase [Duodenibacillus sp.]|nr:nucleoside hydrolase [Duodenibacillus sp.]
MTTKLLLDCDPGYDDAIALMLAYAHPELELLAVTTVGGNQSLDKVTANALSIAQALGKTHIPIARGADRPLVEPLRDASFIHGATGLDGVALPAPDFALLDSRHAVNVIIDTVMQEPAGTVTLVPTGPLTNIALAVRLEPRIVERVKEVVLMGGAYAMGNASPVAEFNVFTDPEAAHIVFDAGWKVTMVGLDLTHQARAYEPIRRRFNDLDSAAGRMTREILTNFADTYRRLRRMDGPPVHDACAVALVADPSLVACEPAPVTVELHGGATRGMTVADRRPDRAAGATTFVATQLAVDRFWDLAFDCIGRLP